MTDSGTSAMAIEYPFSVKETLWAGVMPMAVAFVAGIIGLKVRVRQSARGAVVVQTVVLLFVAVAVLVSARQVALTSWKPTSHWHWLPFFGLVAALATPLFVRSKTWAMSTTVIVSIAAAWFLVPDRETLPLPRPVLITLLASSITAVAASVLLPKEEEVASTSRIIVLNAVMLSGLIVLMSAGSLRMALIGFSATSGICGLLLARLCTKSKSDVGHDGLLYAMYLISMLATRRLNSETGLSVWCFMLPAVAPLMMALSPRLPGMNRLSQKAQTAVCIALPIVIAGSAAVIATVTALSDSAAEW